MARYNIRFDDSQAVVLQNAGNTMTQYTNELNTIFNSIDHRIHIGNFRQWVADRTLNLGYLLRDESAALKTAVNIYEVAESGRKSLGEIVLPSFNGVGHMSPAPPVTNPLNIPRTVFSAVKAATRVATAVSAASSFAGIVGIKRNFIQRSVGNSVVIGQPVGNTKTKFLGAVGTAVSPSSINSMFNRGLNIFNRGSNIVQTYKSIVQATNDPLKLLQLVGGNAVSSVPIAAWGLRFAQATRNGTTIIVGLEALAYFGIASSATGALASTARGALDGVKWGKRIGKFGGPKGKKAGMIIGGVVGGAIGFFRSDTGQRVLSSVGAWATGAASSAIRFTHNLVVNVGNSITSAARSAINTVSRTVQNVGNSITSAARSVFSFGRSVSNAVTNTVRNVGNTIVSGAQSAVNTVVNTAQNVGNAVTSAARAVTSTVSNAARSVGRALSRW